MQVHRVTNRTLNPCCVHVHGYNYLHWDATSVSGYVLILMMHDLQLLPHSTLGRAISLQLIRRNQQCNVSEAMAPVDINLQYDFDYQQFTFLPNEVRVLPVSNHIKLHV